MVQGSTDLRAGGALRGGPARSRLHASSPSDRCPFALPERRAAGALCYLLASVRRSAAPARFKPVRTAAQFVFGKLQTRRSPCPCVVDTLKSVVEGKRGDYRVKTR